MMNIICHLVNIGLLWVSRSGISSTVSNRAQAYVTVSGDSRPPDTNISAHSAQQHSGSHSDKSVCFFFCLFVCFMDPPAASSHPPPDKTEFDGVEGFYIKPVDFLNGCCLVYFIFFSISAKIHSFMLIINWKRVANTNKIK